MKIVNREEIVWAAGWFEGEGCISTKTTKRPNGKPPYVYPRLSVASTDKDVIDRFVAAVGVGVVKAKLSPSLKAHWKPIWYWEVYGLEPTQAVIAMLWVGLGERRKTRYCEVLDQLLPGIRGTRHYRRRNPL